MIILGAYLSYSLFTRLHVDPVRGDPDRDTGSASRSASRCSSSSCGRCAPTSARSSRCSSPGPSRSASRACSASSTSTTYRSTITGYANNSLTVARLPVLVVRLHGVRGVGGDPARALPAAVAHPAGALDPRDRSEPDVRAAPRDRGDARVGDRLRHQCGDGHRRGRRVYGMHLPVQPRQPLRPHLAAALDRRPAAGSAASAARSSPLSSWGSARRSSRRRSHRPGRSCIFFVVLIAILLVRPQGLFGRARTGRAVSGERSRHGPCARASSVPCCCSRSPSRRTGW